ncbi:hypothetical protein [Streptomyces sp. NBC_01237]|uniref:hypothetical protein n=1 Tax=Streptomyces sp. NBC_01237 TaxID=2903790 RepID=UPI002DDB4309|nr:hypothetical protein [Streptomyces sp. NBC_01237]WRZ78358.1 hypothetical protein OG251_43185 [Streptomyces sp. NBC_01237]
MQLKRDKNSFMLTLTEVELGRLLACVIESAEALSRSEFFIRTGWARNDVRSAISSFDRVSKGELGEISIDIPEPQEEIENLRRPRDRR